VDVERDPVSGRETTGHVWNGIKELDTPVPKGVLIFLIVTHLFAFAWWILMPTWPVGHTYTKGILNTDQRTSVEKHLVDAQAGRAAWMKRIESENLEQIAADPQLMSIVRSTGHRLFGDNCAACHGINAKGGYGYPDLTDDDWIWGGDLETIAQTMRVGVNEQHPQGRNSQMPSFGRDGILDADQVSLAANYIYSLSHPKFVTAANRASVLSGREVFMSNCAICHGEDARGKRDVGAPNLSDTRWIYGGDLDQIVETVHGGRQGHMPTWDERLSAADIKILALYVHSLSSPAP
jgi:cytochrome c oxidase cbb3-type subunit III